MIMMRKKKKKSKHIALYNIKPEKTIWKTSAATPETDIVYDVAVWRRRRRRRRR